jgi:hypothetical protein
VNDIDVSTVALEGVAPLRSAVEDVAGPFAGSIQDPPQRDDCTTDGPDGFDDLTLKFDIQDVVAALGGAGALTDGDVLVLQLTGKLLNGTDIEGVDVVWIKKKGNPSGSFIDGDGSVFELDIEWLAGEGITKGCNPPTNDRFCPDSNVTRGQMAAFLVRALDLTDTLDDPFTDDDDSIFEADIEKLAAAGITKGCNPPTNDRYCPDSTVTRGQMAAFLVRALGLIDDGGGDLLTDDDGSIFESDIDKLGTAGVTKGCNPPTNDRYCPSGVVTRGQMAAFLHRALT